MCFVYTKDTIHLGILSHFCRKLPKDRFDDNDVHFSYRDQINLTNDDVFLLALIRNIRLESRNSISRGVSKFLAARRLLDRTRFTAFYPQPSSPIRYWPGTIQHCQPVIDSSVTSGCRCWVVELSVHLDYVLVIVIFCTCRDVILIL